MTDFINQVKMVNLNVFDKLFLVCMFSVTVGMLYIGATILTFGGIVLICGAFLTYKGQIYLATFTYLIADFCWVYNAWGTSDFKGVVFITAGIIFGMLATYKMKKGYMEKDLVKR